MSLEIRKATEADIPELARIHLGSKRMAESGIINPEFLRSMVQSDLEETWISIFQNEDSQQHLILIEDLPVGYSSFGALRTPPPGTSKIRPLYSSEIYGLYIDPDYFSRGFGTRLLQHAVVELKKQKHESLCLWAMDKNKHACGFYEAMSGKRVGKKMVEFGPTKAKEVCYGWRNINVILEK